MKSNCVLLDPHTTTTVLYKKGQDYFPGPQSQMMLASIAAGNTNAQLWQVAQAEGEVLLLWDKGNNVFYLSGNPLSEDMANELIELINTEIKTRAIAEKRPYFQGRAPAGLAQIALENLFQGFLLGQRRKLFYVFNQPQAPMVASPVLAGVQFQLINGDFLGREYLQNLHYVKGEIEQMWPSLERFCEKGFGIAALLEETIIGWCTAEYVSEVKCGVGIATVEEFENKGVATTMTARFINHCLSHQITPYWECDSENIGSIRVAEKAGFERVQETLVWVGVFQ